MNIRKGRALAFTTAILAVLCGCVLLLALGAPQRMPLMNFAALLVGLVAAQILWLLRGAGQKVSDGALLAAGLALPMTALLGQQAEGVARWIVVGGLTIQPGMILVPLIAVGMASRPNRPRMVAVGLASLGIGLQPDLGTAAMLVFGIGAAVVPTRSGMLAWALVLALAGAAVALARPATLPPVAFVEHIFADALEFGAGTAILALAGVMLLFTPALLVRPDVSKAARATFAGVWAGGLLAAIIGAYPTPVIGFGGSAILGYLLSLSLATFQPRTLGAPANRSRFVLPS